MVDVYKLGRPGYARVLLGIDNVQDAGRAARMVSALAAMDQRRVAQFAASLAELGKARTALDEQSARLKALQADAARAAARATQAAEARAEMVREIDARRDLAAQMVGELESARQKVEQTVAAVGAASAAEPVMLPIRPFRGEIEWPALGAVTSRFGRHRNPRFGTSTIQSGIEIASADGAPVRAVHEGRVAFADVFTGFGQLVIVDHGNLAFSLYGYLGSLGVQKGATVIAGQPIGTAGAGPAGTPAVYFELRIDGKPVDPLQWLKERR
ncbi:MAG TPA: peptidoglycan DD-metalloendopeptidase family protein [Vicinamibacterales bacterium]|jgi:septal ring factor EnvC (AmiA/AmiB activator)